jgi:hypothetical protein
VLNAQGTYPQSTLMAYRLATPLGYHGNELQTYDELGGKDRGWESISSRNFMDLLAVRFLILQEEHPIPGFHKLLGPIVSTFGDPAVLYERDTVPAYARVVASAAKAPEAQVTATVLDPRFPASALALYPDTSGLALKPLVQPFPASKVTASVKDYAPGSMRIALTGTNPEPSFLVVSENWYPDWKATVDGQPAQVHRADHTLLSVVIPTGAHEVALRFESAAYARGKLVSLVSLLLALGLIAAPLLLSRRAPGA